MCNHNRHCAITPRTSNRPVHFPASKTIRTPWPEWLKENRAAVGNDILFDTVLKGLLWRNNINLYHYCCATRSSPGSTEPRNETSREGKMNGLDGLLANGPNDSSTDLIIATFASMYHPSSYH